MKIATHQTEISSLVLIWNNAEHTRLDVRDCLGGVGRKELDMDAKELTKVVEKQDNEICELKKKVEYLTIEFEKQRLLISDMKIDVQMLQRR